MTTEDKIKEIGGEVIDLLVSKNKSYGDSALKPANIFAKGTPVENLCARIDDKLMRIKNKGIGADTEDTVQDLIGYLILLKIAIQDGSQHNDNAQRQGSRDSILQGYTGSTYTYPVREE